MFNINQPINTKIHAFLQFTVAYTEENILIAVIDSPIYFQPTTYAERERT